MSENSVTMNAAIISALLVFTMQSAVSDQGPSTCSKKFNSPSYFTGSRKLETTRQEKSDFGHSQDLKYANDLQDPRDFFTRPWYFGLLALLGLFRVSIVSQECSTASFTVTVTSLSVTTVTSLSTLITTTTQNSSSVAPESIVASETVKLTSVDFNRATTVDILHANSEVFSINYLSYEQIDSLDDSSEGKNELIYHLAVNY